MKELVEQAGIYRSIPIEIIKEAYRLIKVLDGAYGADRDVDLDDGGFVVVAETVEDVESISRQYVDISARPYEAADIVKCRRGDYWNLLYLNNNEFGINVLIPQAIMPRLAQ